jgi:hypothetical protein
MTKNVQAERSVSLWMPVPEMANQSTIHDVQLDLVVVGSGIAGLSVAYEALAKGRRVTILDRGGIGSGMTARTTAHLASALDDYYHEFISQRGEEEARLLHESLSAAIDRIEQISRTDSTSCDFNHCDGYLFLGEGDTPATLEKEMEACRRIGFAGVTWEARAPIPDFDTGPCLRFPRQGRFHPLKYLQVLAHAITSSGGDFRPYTGVESISQHENVVNLKLSDGTILAARDVVCATNSSIAGPTILHTKMAPYRTYAMAFSVPKASITDALYWDTLEAYHYVRLQPGRDSDFLIVGGEDHKTGEADDALARFSNLEKWTRRRFKSAAEITHRWSGQVLEPIDFAGFIGQHPDYNHIWLVTGDSGQGITNGAVAGLLLPSLMDGHDHPWRKLYEPARITPMAAGNFIAENVTAVINMAAHLEGPILPAEDTLSPGEGGLVRHGLKTAAVFCDSYGTLHRLASSCSHLGCTVHFNSFERCWDCPCHGSHFALDGEPINAPATSPLKKLE